MTSKSPRDVSFISSPSFAEACVHPVRRVAPSPEYIESVSEDSVWRNDQCIDDADALGTKAEERHDINAAPGSLKKIQLYRRERALGKSIRFSKRIASIVEVMRNNPGSSYIQKKGFRALCELSYHDSCSQSLIYKAGGIEVILSGMKKFSMELALQLWGLKALINITQKNAVNQVEVYKRKGVTIILEGMKLHFTDADFLVVCFLALGNLCTKEKKNREAVREAEVVLFFIIAGMKYHSKSSDVQQAGCGLLANLSCQENLNKHLIVEAGGVEAILIAMRSHPSDPKVFKFACAALTNICRTDQGLTLLKSGQGVGAIVHCLHLFPEQCSAFAAPLLQSLNSDEPL
jgi:hypothetical protein